MCVFVCLLALRRSGQACRTEAGGVCVDVIAVCVWQYMIHIMTVHTCTCGKLSLIKDAMSAWIDIFHLCVMYGVYVSI